MGEGAQDPRRRLDAESAPSALPEPLKEHDASMTEDALDIAMRETLGSPFFLHLFGRRLVEAMNAAGSGQADESPLARVTLFPNQSGAVAAIPDCAVLRPPEPGDGEPWRTARGSRPACLSYRSRAPARSG